MNNGTSSCRLSVLYRCGEPKSRVYTRIMKESQTWTVGVPERLDAFLTHVSSLGSRACAQRAIADGRVTVNGAVVYKIALRLHVEDCVVLCADHAIRATSIDARDMPLSILYEDARCIVLDKPAGLAVHPAPSLARGEATLLHGVAALLHARGLPFVANAVLVHRLDRETTGCLLVAKDTDAHRVLQEQFRSRSVQKEYLAIVTGLPSPAAAVIDAPVGRSIRHRTRMAVLGASAPRTARTTYRTIGIAAQREAALLHCILHTGRTHQLRVHLATINSAILGDQTYGDAIGAHLARAKGIAGLCLHAWKLTFVPPDERTAYTVTAPIPPAFRAALDRMHIAARTASHSVFDDVLRRVEDFPLRVARDDAVDIPPGVQRP